MRNCYSHSWATIVLILCVWLSGCVADERPECIGPKPAQFDRIERIFFEPYLDNRFRESSDTVLLNEFKYHIEMGFERVQPFPSTFDLEQAPICPEIFWIQNVSNFAIILEAPFNGIQVGEDISYLFLLPDGTRIGRFRQFRQIPKIFSLSLSDGPDLPEPLLTKFVVYFTDGSSLETQVPGPFIRK